MSKKLPLGAWLSFYIVQSDLCGGRPQPVYSHKGMKEQAANLPLRKFFVQFTIRVLNCPVPRHGQNSSPDQDYSWGGT